MRRRAFLATAGTLLTAGCGALTGGGGSGSGGDSARPFSGDDDFGVSGDWEAPEVGDAEVSGDIGEADINVSEIDDIDNSEIRDVDFDTSIRGNEGTATPENQDATVHIANARVKLQEAYHTYVGQSTGRRQNLRTIQPTQSEFRSITVKNRVDEAFTDLEEAAPHATPGQAANIRALEHVGVFLHLSAKIDRLLVASFDHFEFAMERVFNMSFAQGDLARRRMAEDFQEAKDTYDEMAENVDPASMRVFSLLTENQYEEKLRRFDGQIAAFQSFDESIPTIVDGIRNVSEGVSAWGEDRWQDAQNAFLRGSAQFGAATTSFTLVPSGTGLEAKATELTRVVRVMEQATEDLKRAAQAMVDGERPLFYQAERAAEAHIESNDTVKNIDPFNDIAV